MPFSPELHAEVSTDVTVGFAVVTGTHSTGKTTVINDYLASLQPLDPRLQSNIEPLYGAGIEHVAGLPVPVVTVPEAATLHARIAGQPSLLTTDYSFHRQIMIEFNGAGWIVDGLLQAAQIASLLQVDYAILLADRTPLDGHVYSRLRTPEYNQELVDLRTVGEETGLLLTHPDQKPVNIRHLTRSDISRDCDIAFIADPRGIDLEDNNLRMADKQFQLDVARLMEHYYEIVVGSDRISHLRGNRLQRRQQLQQKLESLITTRSHSF